jgi:hypothetical protein
VDRTPHFIDAHHLSTPERDLPQFGRYYESLLRGRNQVWHSKEPPGCGCRSCDPGAKQISLLTSLAPPCCRPPAHIKEGHLSPQDPDTDFTPYGLPRPSSPSPPPALTGEITSTTQQCSSDPHPDCCVRVFCDVLVGKRMFHCRIQLEDCSGNHEWLELGASGGGIQIGSHHAVTLTRGQGSRPNPLPRIDGRSSVIFEYCEACSLHGCWSWPGTGCSVGDCLVERAMSYPIHHYNPFGPNSNTFVTYVSTQCGLRIPPRPGGHKGGAEPGFNMTIEEANAAQARWDERFG